MSLSLFYRKRVALIGPAPHVAQMFQREQIDGFDTVCRLNFGLPIPEAVQARTGFRCDVLFMHPRIPEHPEWQSPTVKAIVARRHVQWDQEVEVYSEAVKAKMSLMDTGAERDCIEGCNSHPSTGAIAAMHILRYEPACLYLTGFTFYRQTGHAEEIWYPGYTYAMTEEQIAQVVNRDGVLNGHYPDREMAWFRSAVAPRIQMDPVLMEILQ